ncbi:MAG: hypothetical protein KGJ43_09630, partial [Acidobacteriota bacterium]|nr:hypothetical protein [Acidobacteriota bacterium]
EEGLMGGVILGCTARPRAGACTRARCKREMVGRVARVLIVGADERAVALGAALRAAGHAARVVLPAGTLEPGDPDESRATGAGVELLAGDPDRLATMRGVLEQVTVACWLLGSVTGEPALIEALHGPRLEAFMGQVVDSSARGFLYESAGSVPAALLESGALRAREIATRNAIELAVLGADPADREAWIAGAVAQIAGLIGA